MSKSEACLIRQFMIDWQLQNVASMAVTGVWRSLSQSQLKSKPHKLVGNISSLSIWYEDFNKKILWTEYYRWGSL